VFFDNLYKICKQKNTTPNGMAKTIGISSGSVTSWKKGTVPKSDTLQKIAEYFNVSTDYLLGNEQKENNSPESELSRQILSEVENCSETEAKFILEQIKLIKSLRNK